MKKKGVPSNKIRFAFIIAILIGIFFLLRFISLRPFQKGNTSETYKTVISKKLHFQIAVPTTYGYFEKNASLHVTHGDDEIIITNSGRMFDSLDKELKFLSKHNDITIEKLAMIQPDFYKLKITGNHSKKEEIIYKYFSDNGMYTFEATSPGSYDVLDKIARSFHVLSTQSNTYVTPTVVPAQTIGSLRAYNPQGKFWFEYPKEWLLTIEDTGYNDHFYNVYLSPKDKANDFKISFINGGKGLPNFDSDKIEFKIINGKNTKWWTLYRKNQPFFLAILFLDPKDSIKLNAIEVKLPPENQEVLYKSLENLIATIK